MLRLTSFVGILLLLGGCILEDALDRLAEFEERQFTLQPNFNVGGVVRTIDSYNSGVCWPPLLDRHRVSQRLVTDWVAAFPQSPPDLLVGYESELVRGQDPLPCNLWHHERFQAFMFFPLVGALPREAVIQKADLNFRRRSVDAIDGGPDSEPCNYVLGEVTRSPFLGGVYRRVSGRDNDVKFVRTLPETTVTGGSIDVTRTVASWFMGVRTNTGFVMSIEDGRSFVEHDEDDDYAYCASYVSNIELVVTALVPPGS